MKFQWFAAALFVVSGAMAETSSIVPNGGGTIPDATNSVKGKAQCDGITTNCVAGVISVTGGTTTNAQTGASYTILSTDSGKLVTLANASSIAVTLPQAGTTGFGTDFGVCILNLGPGTATVTPTTSTFNLNATQTLAPRMSMCPVSDGTNYAGGVGTPLGVFTASITIKLRTVTAAGDITVSAVSDYFVCVKKTSGAATVVNLPGSPTTGLTFLIKDCKGDATSNNITITPASGTIDGAATVVVSTNYQSLAVTFNGSEWSIN